MQISFIDVFICKLRKKLALAGAETLIGTVWGRGYMIREPTSNQANVPQPAMLQPTAV